MVNGSVNKKEGVKEPTGAVLVMMSRADSSV